MTKMTERIDPARGAREDLIPKNILDQVSQTSWAQDCFINQRFSGSLQSFLVGYVNSVYSQYAVSDA